MKKDKKPWDSHYKKTKSILIYPDENLVRLLKSYIATTKKADIKAVDIGCGTGRHLKLLKDTGVNTILGIDNSKNALSIIDELYGFPVVQGENAKLPFKDKTFDVAISWGSLHYCRKENTREQISEAHRILKSKGFLFGTLRSERDKYLQRGKSLGGGSWITDLGDLKNQVVSFYSENELHSLFSRFKKFEYGIIERTVMGDMDKLISHWIFRAEK